MSVWDRSGYSFVARSGAKAADSNWLFGFLVRSEPEIPSGTSAIRAIGVDDNGDPEKL